MTQINVPTKQKQTHKQRNQICGCPGRWGIVLGPIVEYSVIYEPWEMQLATRALVPQGKLGEAEGRRLGSAESRIWKRKKTPTRS